MNVILGIDQGATNTRAAVMDRTGTVVGYRSHHNPVKVCWPDCSVDDIARATEGALADAGATADDVEMVVAGIAGIDWEGDDKRATQALRAYFTDQPVVVVNDAVIAYYAGSTGPLGAVVVAGTGLNAAFFTPDGSTYVLSDYLKDTLQGSSAIVRRAVDATIQAHLGGGDPTALTEPLLRLGEVDDVRSLLRRYLTDEEFARDAARFAPTVIDIARDGDAAARGLLGDLVDELVDYLVATLRSKGMLGRAYDLVLSGSALRETTTSGGENLLRRMLVERLGPLVEPARIVDAPYDAVVGACLYGLSLSGSDVDDAVMDKVRPSAEKLGLTRNEPARRSTG
jgi:N-acetylglucosamine kinase-like BadF-type ATPase